MAKYAPSALLGRLSRSAGSTTFAHNRFGAYLRNRVIPTNPVSEAQTAVRSTFAAFSAQYRDLTEAQRNSWIAFGDNFARTDSLGQSYGLTGLQAFVSVNQNLATAGGASVTVPPLFDIPAGLVSATPTIEDTPTFTIAYTATPLPTGSKLVIEATRQLSAGINFQQRGAYKQIFVTAAAAASPANVAAGYAAVFGSPLVVGAKILFRAYIISGSGLASPALTFSGVVASGS